MRIAGSNRFLLDPREERNLARMARGGEASDSSSESIEEITAEAFKHDSRGAPRSRVRDWDLMRFPVSGNYYSPQLYKFAWAQAVQNKPLGLDVVGKESCDMVIEDSSEESGVDVGDDGEKEEGELEEGEIDLDSEPAGGEMKVDLGSNQLESKVADESNEPEEPKDSEEMGELDRRVNLILEELESVSEEEVEKSLESACFRLRKCFESLKEMSAEESCLVVGALVQHAFMGIQTVQSAYSAWDEMRRNQNKDMILRLLIHIKNRYHMLLTPEQIKEIDAAVQSLVFEDVNKDSAKLTRKDDSTSGDLSSSQKPCPEAKTFVSVGTNRGRVGLPKLETSSVSRRDFGPLLDLHADYDEGSLPSPTRDNPPPLPVLQPIGGGFGAAVSPQSRNLKNAESEDASLHPYVTDALKAVSCYQQKYGKPSLLTTNRLPSPTPSEENKDNDDSHGEVSSSSVNARARAVNSMAQFQTVVSSTSSAHMDRLSGQLVAPVKTIGQCDPVPNPVTKVAPKSRDPRLRFINSEAADIADPKRRVVPPESALYVDGNVAGAVGHAITSRKHRAVDESLVNENTLKRQRSAFAEPRDGQMTSGRGRWLEDGVGVGVVSQPSTGSRLNVNLDASRKLDVNTKITVTSSGTGQNPAVHIERNSSGSTASTGLLPSLLKDIAVNPTMLVQLLKMEQQRLAGEQQKSSDPTQLLGLNKLPETVSSVNDTAMKSPETTQNHAGKGPMPAPTASVNPQNDKGMMRMKPRDPRRILHNNMIQKSETLGSVQVKMNGHPPSDIQVNKESIKVRDQGVQAQTSTLPSQTISPWPNIASHFTKNLKNPADIMTSSNNAPAVPQNSSGLSGELGTAKAPELLDHWGDVDHLLDGYDDQQKAAIQRERARRIQEQNKMFAARKLCLVLDLDHTLLNSAKFVEIDPSHDEILRKKEELDREKPLRHLFRLPHMGMWTKLRPGVWNFLEKASKLFELHVYTMGNKLYATEMAKVLDPSGALFAGRVISRGDDSDPLDGDEKLPRSKDLDGVLGMESAVVIIDDSLRVWPHNKLNLIVVERYTYFPCSRRQFGLLGPSLLEIDHDERPEDGTLASALSVIERIHQNFFSQPSLNNVDVRNILAAEQQKILSGCRIVFSRIFPVGEANPQLHPLWQTAEQFGAVCTNHIDEHVTHVVANSLGTDKVNWALSTGRFVVHPGWVEASALLYRRANEHDFAVKI